MDDKVVIIVLNYNQNDYTIKCVNSILTSTYHNFNILLVDNGSDEDKYLSLEKVITIDPIILLKRIPENRGYVGGTNFGLLEGIKLKPDYFLIMNNDTVIDRNSITALVNACKRYNNKALVTGKVYHYEVKNKLQNVGYNFKNKYLDYIELGLNETDNGQYNVESERDMIDDVFWLFPTSLYETIGGYSNYFWFNAEQADLALRAGKVGYKLIYNPDAKIWHKGSVSIGGGDYNPNQAYWTTQSLLILKFIHLNKLNFSKYYLTIIISIIRTFIKSFYFKLLGERDISSYAKAKFLGWVYFNKWLFVRNDNTGYNPLN